MHVLNGFVFIMEMTSSSVTTCDLFTCKYIVRFNICTLFSLVSPSVLYVLRVETCKCTICIQFTSNIGINILQNSLFVCSRTCVRVCERLFVRVIIAIKLKMLKIVIAFICPRPKKKTTHGVHIHKRQLVALFCFD